MPRIKKGKGNNSETILDEGADVTSKDNELEPSDDVLEKEESVKATEDDSVETAEVVYEVESVLPGRKSRESARPLDPTHMYLKEIGFSPLLTAEDEVKFGRRAI